MVVVATSATSLSVANCSRQPVDKLAQTSSPLMVAAAASLQNVMQAIRLAYRDVALNVTITYNFGASGSLAQQIAQGAPIDIFITASPQWMDELAVKEKIVAGSRRDLLQNQMVLVVPRDRADIATLADLNTARVKRMAIGEPNSVPAGRYAKEALTSKELFGTLKPKLVFTKDVRQVLAYVETGNVDAGLVYATDAQRSNRVRVVATAIETQTPIVYPAAIIRASKAHETAQNFMTFLFSDAARTLFQAYGFAAASSVNSNTANH